MAATDISTVAFAPNDVVNNWKIVKQIGEGACGTVFKVERNGRMYAMKTESTSSVTRLIEMEVIVLRALKNASATHFCEIFDSGKANNTLFVVMTLIGKSLWDLRKKENGTRMTPACALSVGLQCLEALQELHNTGYLHRDVKPGNFAVALDNPRKVILFDFGMSRRFLDKDNALRKPRLSAGFRGTVRLRGNDIIQQRYAPLSCHYARELSRKDDLEAWLYQQIELTSGQLPWKNMDDAGQVAQAKERGRTLDVRELFGNCPKEYIQILFYIDSLKYFEAPRYSVIRGLLKEAMAASNLTEWYDWDIENSGKKPALTPAIATSPAENKNKPKGSPCK